MFITFEGIDGSGKSTQARLLAETLRTNGLAVTLTREPGGSPGAEEIRRLLVDGDPGRWSPETEMLLFTAARRDHVERIIRPALDRGEVVVSDRFVDSTRAYQGVAGRRELVDSLHDLMIGFEADLTLIFDLDPALALARAGGRGGGEDRFERKGVEFQRALQVAFLETAAADLGRYHIIPADGAAEDVAAMAARVVLSKLEQHGG